jgi:hypothetical protein
VLRGLFPELDWCGPQDARFSPTSDLAFADGRVRYPSENRSREDLDRSRSDFLASTIFEMRRHAIEQRRELFDKLAAAVREVASIEQAIGGLQQRLEVADTSPQLALPGSGQ